MQGQCWRTDVNYGTEESGSTGVERRKTYAAGNSNDSHRGQLIHIRDSLQIPPGRIDRFRAGGRRYDDGIGGSVSEILGRIAMKNQCPQTMYAAKMTFAIITVILAWAGPAMVLYFHVLP